MWTAIVKFFGGLIAKGFFKNPAVIITGLVLLIGLLFLIPNFTKVAGWFGYETKESLKQTVQIQKQSIQTLQDANEATVKTTKVLEKTIENIQASATRLENAKIEVKKIPIKINKARIEKIKEVESRVVTDPAAVPNIPVEVSQIQIDAIWMVYCQTNTDVDHPECKVVQETMGR